MVKQRRRSAATFISAEGRGEGSSTLNPPSSACNPQMNQGKVWFKFPRLAWSRANSNTLRSTLTAQHSITDQNLELLYEQDSISAARHSKAPCCNCRAPRSP